MTLHSSLSKEQEPESKRKERRMMSQWVQALDTERPGHLGQALWWHLWEDEIAEETEHFYTVAGSVISSTTVGDSVAIPQGPRNRNFI